MPRLLAAHAPPLLAAARALFIEYAASIHAVAGDSLAYQHFDDELATLPGKYAPPQGRIYLAVADDDPHAKKPLGCIALRPLPSVDASGGPVKGRACELKRMYVRPAARGLGIGRLLATRILADAAAIGYAAIYLDTTRSMTPAIALYRSLGFAECPAYNDDPDVENTLWFSRSLATAPR